MQELEFRLIYQHDESGRFVTTFLTLDELLHLPPGHATTKILPPKQYNLISVGQFIDRLDVDNKKIFAGDIVNVTDSTGDWFPTKEDGGENFIVRWSSPLCGFALWYSNSGKLWLKDTNPWRLFCYPHKNEIKIIGNEVENPKLLNNKSTPLIVSLDQLKKVQEFRAKVNATPLECIVWTLGGKPYTIPTDVMEDLKFSGLFNTSILDLIEELSK